MEVGGKSAGRGHQAGINEKKGTRGWEALSPCCSTSKTEERATSPEHMHPQLHPPVRDTMNGTVYHIRAGCHLLLRSTIYVEHYHSHLAQEDSEAQRG